LPLDIAILAIVRMFSMSAYIDSLPSPEEIYNLLFAPRDDDEPDWKELYDQLAVEGITAPDVVFDIDLFDPSYAKDMNETCPLSESRRNGQYLKGCYAFFEAGVKRDETFIPLYVGKSVRLRSRIKSHWKKGEWLADWFDKRWDEVETYFPVVAVWFTDKTAGFETELIQRLKPIYNKRIE
jgi:hypothetical protein